jgi:hypothetical protein
MTSQCIKVSINLAYPCFLLIAPAEFLVDREVVGFGAMDEVGKLGLRFGGD